MNAAQALPPLAALPPWGPDDLAERMAVLEFDAGRTREEAEAEALRAAGYDTPGAWARAVAAHWRASILTARPQTDAGRQAVADALAFIDGSGAALAAAGWCEADLFGVPGATAPGGLAFRLKGGRLERVTAGALGYVTGSYMARGEMRPGAAQGSRPFWDVGR